MSAGKPSVNRRWWLWLPLLAAGAWLSLFGDKSPAGSAVASAPPPAVTAIRPQPLDPATPASSAALALVPRDQLIAAPHAVGSADAPPRDLFSARSWTPPPPAAPATVAAPVAPPVPYALLGKKLEADTWEVFLSRNEQTFVVRAGQVLEGEWRVDRISPPSLALTYLPLGQALTLSIGEAR